MIIDLEKMSGKEKELYEKMWSDFDFSTMDVEIRKTNGSKNSYCFDGEGDIAQVLIKAFDIENKDFFLKKYDMATSGSGKEKQKINILRSSSLCALLHFYNVTEDKDNYNPLILEFETNKHKRKVRFTSSVFEYKSPVIDNNHPSNMDVVLIGKDLSTDEKIVLFLESKFFEYFIDASDVIKKAISRQYLIEKRVSAPLYDSSFLEQLGLIRFDVDNGHFKLRTLEGEKLYIDGIKQMISHYTGVMNVLHLNRYEEKDKERIEIQKEVEEALDSGAIAILGEILFDGRIKALAGDDYTKRYKVLASRIAELTKENERFEIVMNDLKYSLFKDNTHRIELKIKEFYRHYELEEKLIYDRTLIL